MTTINKYLILPLLLLAGVLLVPAQATQLPTQRAVLPQYGYAFDYSAQTMQVYHHSDDRVAIAPTYLPPTGGFEIMITDFHFVPEDTTLEVLLENHIDAHLSFIGSTFTQIEIAGHPALHANAVSGTSETQVLFIDVDGHFYRIEQSLVSQEVPALYGFAQDAWTLITESIDFAAPELDQSNSDANCVNDAAFVADMSIPDGIPIEAGTQQVKTWQLNNDGTCTWDGSYRFEQIAGVDLWWSELGDHPTPLVPYTEPGEDAFINLEFVLDYSFNNGEQVFSQFQLVSPEGDNFGTRPFLQVEVTNGITTFVPTAPAPPPYDPNYVPPTATYSPPLVQPTIVPENSLLIGEFTATILNENEIELQYTAVTDSPITRVTLSWGVDGEEISLPVSPTNTQIINISDMPGYVMGNQVWLLMNNENGGFSDSLISPESGE